MNNTRINLMDWIKNKGISVECFAMMAKIDKSYVYKIIRGEQVPSDKLMKKIKKITMGDITKPEDLVSESYLSLSSASSMIE